jgi:hypothetical protein
MSRSGWDLFISSAARGMLSRVNVIRAPVQHEWS